MTTLQFIVVAISVASASCLQGAIGFGLGMVAGPVIALVDPHLLPGSILLMATAVAVLVMVFDRSGLDLRGTGWALTGRVPGSLLGAYLVALLPARYLALGIAVLIVVSVVTTSRGWAPIPSRRNLIIAGMASGVFGTAAAIGGPPLAMVWQSVDAARLRATMSAFQVVSSGLGIGFLLLAHALSRASVMLAVVMLPAVAAGWFLSRWANHYLDRRRLRLLGASAAIAGAMLLIATNL
jgi:uncharacterized membrane protein YfcA